MYRKDKRKDKPEPLKKNMPEPNHLFAFGLIPPETPSQSMILNSLVQKPSGYFLSDRKGYIINVNNTDKKTTTIEAQWDICLRSTVLKPLYQGELYLKDIYLEYSQDEMAEAIRQTE